MNPWAVGLCVLLGGAAFAGAYGTGSVAGKQHVQALWDAEKLKQALARDQRYDQLQTDASKARAETEAIRQNYIDFKAGKKRETDELERAVAAGAKRLSVHASCPGSVPQAGTSASGTTGGTAILDADAGRNYYAYRRAYDEQFATLKLCRDELIKRSAK